MKPNRISINIKLFFLLLSSIGIIIYWVSTIIYVMPNNYLKIKLDGYLSMYEKPFYQAWNFFAPPPQYDTRIYFTYRSKRDSADTSTYEITSSINNAKRKGLPFNSDEEIVEYIISYSSSAITEGYSKVIKAYNLSYPDSTEESNLEKAYSVYLDLIKEDTPVETLERYARLVCLKAEIGCNDKLLDIHITSYDILPFNSHFSDVPYDTVAHVTGNTFSIVGIENW